MDDRPPGRRWGVLRRRQSEDMNSSVSDNNKICFRTLFVLSLLTLQLEARNITLGLLLPYNVTSNSSALGMELVAGNSYISAMVLAVQAIANDSSLLNGHSVTFIWNDTQCKDEFSVKALLDQMSKGVEVFIGPACTCETTAKVASAFNIPVISYVSMHYLKVLVNRRWRNKTWTELAWC